MRLPLLYPAAVGLALLGPPAHAKTVVLGNAQNGKLVTLAAGDTLVIRLSAKPEMSARAWHIVYDPGGLLTLSGSRTLSPSHPNDILIVHGGDPVTQEFRLTAPRSKQDFVKGAWLRFLFLDPFKRTVTAPKFWQIQYTIRAGT